MLDDSLDSRAADRRLVERSDTLRLAGEGQLGGEAAATVLEVQPDVITVSLEEPLNRGIRTIEALSLSQPDIPIVALSSLGDHGSLRQAMLAGVRDYLVRPLDAGDFAQALLAAYAAQGKRRLSGQAVVSAREGQVITVFGAKGGIGRTMLACNLAVALVQACGRRVAMIDLDLQFGDVGLLLDVAPERSVANIVPVMDKLDTDLLDGLMTRHETGLMVLPAPIRLEDGEQIRPNEVRRLLEMLTKSYDYVIVDTPRQLSDNVIATLDASNQVFCVSSNQLACLKNTSLCLATMKAWQYDEDKVKLIINETHNGTGLSPQETSEAIDYPILWKVPYDGHLVAANQWGKPFVQAQPKAKISQNITGLARAVAGTPDKKRGLFSRIRRG
jgi:pilus assembly protein CpaE